MNALPRSLAFALCLGGCGLLGLRDGGSQQPSTRPTMPRQHGNPIPEKPAAGKEPRLVFEREFHEFGDVDEGPEFETEFRFKNEGKGDLKILGEIIGCGCLATWYLVEGKLYDWGEPIPPGASGSVHFVLKTSGFSNDKNSQVDVITNDPARPPAMLASNAMVPFGVVPIRVHANIRRQFQVEPSNGIMIGTLYNMEPATFSLRVRSLFGKPIEVLGIEPNNDPLFRSKMTCENADKTSWKVEITIPAGQQPQSVTKALKLVTKPELPLSSLYLLGSIRGPVEVTPEGIAAFGLQERGHAALKQYTIANKNSELPLKITGLQVLDLTGKPVVPSGNPRGPAATMADHLQVTVDETVKGKQVKVTIELRETMPAGAGGARIVFDTGIPKGPASITIPVSWIVR